MAPGRHSISPSNYANILRLFFSLVLFLPLALSESPSVTLESGIYRAVVAQLPNSPTKVHKYLGIPFAAPPLHHLRFAPPQPLAPSHLEKDAFTQAPACIQNGGNKLLKESEDCLYLNVFVPASEVRNQSTGGKTVMVWLFGGGLQSGAATVPLYDGSNFAAKQDVILVAPNYRTNVEPLRRTGSFKKGLC